MSQEKDKLIKQYYYMLALSLILYFVVMVILKYTGLFNIGDYKLIFLVITFLYYVVAKNSLSRYYKKKIYEVDPSLKKEKVAGMSVVKERFTSSWKKLFRSTTLLYVIGIIIIVLLYSVFAR